METELINAEERFTKFIENFRDEKGTYVYEQRLGEMAAKGESSLIVDFNNLYTSDMELAEAVLRDPDEYLPHFSEAVLNKFRSRDREYAEKIGTANVRLRGLLELVPLRKIGSNHMGHLIMVNGIIVRASSTTSLLMRAAFRCSNCGEMSYAIQGGQMLRTPARCESCGKKVGFDLVTEESTFIDTQHITIQERPEELPPGQLPRSVSIEIRGDLVDVARPGDRTSIVGIVRANPRVSRGGTSRVFDLYLDANYIDVSGKELEAVLISPEDEEQIKLRAKDPFIDEEVKRSIAPSIYGYEHIKEAIMYLLFSGVTKFLPDVNIRGDINVLLVGDPGTGKSQLLQYASKIAPRGLYTTGRGSTAAGLTAAVVREAGGGFVLEAGALVLGDKGICCVDEIDKMRDEDRNAIHPAMEQQTVSVAKGGIIATLNARTSILAAANPALGRYNPYQTIGQNINLPITILSRFDLIFVLKDEPNKESDSRMSEHILTLHKVGRAPVEPPLESEFLRKYISYSKQLKPVISQEAMDRIKDYYLKMRSASKEGAESSAISITPRQLESLVRLSEARARLHLRSEVLAEDAEAVIALMRRSLEQVGIDTTTGEIDIDIIMTGKPKSLQDKLQKVLTVLTEMERSTGTVRDEDLFQRLEEDQNISRGEATRLLATLSRDGTIFSPRPGYFKKV
jgi:replicative DNA helicase Mcm